MIATPTWRAPWSPWEAARARAGDEIEALGHEVHYFTIRRDFQVGWDLAHVADCRTELWSKIREAGGYDWLLWLDDDTRLPPGGSTRLFQDLADYQIDGVSALVWKRDSDGPVFWPARHLEEGWKLGRVYEVASLGLAATLLPVPALAILPVAEELFFSHFFDDRGEIANGEDVGFSRKARGAGLRLGCDTGVIGLHWHPDWGDRPARPTKEQLQYLPRVEGAALLVEE